MNSSSDTLFKYDSLVERGVGHQLQTTPEEYLDEVWRENCSGEVESLEEDNNFDSDGTAREKSCREPRPKDRQTNKRWMSRTDPDASLITRKGWLKPILAHKVHIAVDGGKARIVTACNQAVH